MPTSSQPTSSAMASTTTDSLIFAEHSPLNHRSMNTTSVTMCTSGEDLLENLDKQLAGSRARLDEWAKEQMAACDQVTERYRQEMKHLQSEIDNKNQSMVAWKMEKQFNIAGEETDESADLNQQQEEEESLKSSITVLQEKIKEQKSELIALEEEKRKEQAYESRRAQKLSESENRTKEIFEELQSIVNAYQDLSGMHFEKAGNEKLGFSFQGLDKEDRNRQFSLSLSTTSDDLYLVEDCEPPVSEEALAGLVSELNDSDELGRFLLGMRTLWIESLSENKDSDDE